MIPSFVVVLPAIDPELTRTCLKSMCRELIWDTVLVDNTGTGIIADEHFGHVGGTITYLENAGVPRAWNEGVAHAQSAHADYLIIMSTSIEWGAAAGRDFLAELAARRPEYIMHSQFGWHAIALNMQIFDTVGQFDPVFSPAYYEEGDLMYRMHLAGLPCPLYNDGRYDQINIDATSAGDAMTLKRGLVTVDYAQMGARYTLKWGGMPCHETFTHPYNEPSLDWTYIGEPSETS